jgi:hypothetical protein
MKGPRSARTQHRGRSAATTPRRKETDVSTDEPFAPDPGDVDDELEALAVGVDLLDDVIKLLDAVDDIVIAHRRRAGDDHHEIARLQRVSARVGDAANAATSARSTLRSRHG